MEHLADEFGYLKRQDINNKNQQLPDKMSQPESMKNTPWTGFSSESYGFINDDFPHQKFLTFKTTQKTSGSTIKLKSSLARKGDSMKLSEDLKFWFNLRNNSKLYVRVKDDSLKVHYDHGIVEFANNRKYNFYGGYQCDRKLGNGVAKIGACYIADNMRCDHRFSFDALSKKPELTYYHKSSYARGDKWKFQLYGVFSLSRKLMLNNGLLIGYKKGQHEFFLRAEADQWRKDNMDFSKPSAYFKEYNLDYVRKLSDTAKAGLEFHLFSTAGDVKGITATYEKVFKEENATVKWRFNSAMNLALAIKRSMGSFGNYTVGFEISDLGRANNIKFGSEFNINL